VITYKKARKLDDLLVDCREDQAMLVHRENQSDGILCLKRDEFDSLNGRQILKRFNARIDELLLDIETDRPIEIKPGHPQLKWCKETRSWSPAGDVLRCEVSWNPPGPHGAIAIKIDDQLLTGEEFLSLLIVNEGWGMRIEFMHPNRLANPPEPIIQTKGRK